MTHQKGFTTEIIQGINLQKTSLKNNYPTISKSQPNSNIQNPRAMSNCQQQQPLQQQYMKPIIHLYLTTPATAPQRQA